MSLIRISATFCFIVLLSVLTGAQTLSVENTSVNHEDKNIPAVKVIMSPAPKEVKNQFKDFIKDNYDVKMKGIGFLSNKDVLSAENILLKGISENNMDFYTKVIEKGDETEMYVFGKLGYDIYLAPQTPRQGEYRAMKNLTIDFLNQFLPEYYQDRIDQTQDMLSDLKDNQKDLKEDISDNQDKISKLEDEISEWKTELKENEKKINAATKKLNNRKNSLQTVNEKLRQTGDKK